jgi:pimeloyl-ACP methyl ester carboxylesterase
VAASRRCIAPDLLCHGQTRERFDADVSVAGQAEALLQLLDALEIGEVDLVANDTGGAVAQILAARHPRRVRSLTLTNCDTHDGWPPPAFERTHQLALQGGLPDVIRSFVVDPKAARARFAVAFEDPETLSDERIRAFLPPLVATPERAAQLERMFRALDCAQTVAVEPLLRELRSPTLIVWGTADVFFDVKWARWLCATIPGTRRLVELAGAKLFFSRPRGRLPRAPVDAEARR